MFIWSNESMERIGDTSSAPILWPIVWPIVSVAVVSFVAGLLAGLAWR